MANDSTSGVKIDVPGKYTHLRIVRTSKDTGDRITEKAIQGLGKKTNKPSAFIQIDPNKQYQSILGFGGAFTESGAYVLSKAGPEKQREIIDAYFSPLTGLNYTLCRCHINSCDFSLNNYSCDDTDGDVDLKNFNIDRDRLYLIPFIRAAITSAKSPIRLVATPWSPPAWMKTNGQMNLGGSLKKEYRACWALFFSKFIQEYAKEGIEIWGISVQNEPLAKQTWDSCEYTADEECEFIRDYLGPRLWKDGFRDKKILIWDHNRDLIYDWANIILADPETAKYVWGIGFHWYSGDQFDNVQNSYCRFPEKHLLFTEGCIERGVKLGQWDRGEIYAHNMINDFNNGAEGWIDWNMVLDQKGGPNHAQNYCDAPVIINTESNEVFYQSSYYYIGQFSKFISIGARRIGCLYSGVNLEAAAFLNPDSTIVLVVLNQQNEICQFELEVLRNSTTIVCPGHSIQTIILN